MSEIKDGGPAFPTFDMNGMSLRDWFAGMAIRIETHPGNFSRDTYLIAQSAYALADAMIKIKERDKK